MYNIFKTTRYDAITVSAFISFSDNEIKKLLYFVFVQKRRTGQMPLNFQ